MLLMLVTRYSERVEWLEKFGRGLLAFAEKGVIRFLRFIFHFYSQFSGSFINFLMVLSVIGVQLLGQPPYDSNAAFNFSKKCVLER